MLSLRDVTVRYDGSAAVDGVTIDVADGEVVALLGPSGCGKSTLLRAIAGIEPIASGRILWDDVDLAKIPVHRRGFGLMFQDGVLFPHRSVAGNVGYGLRTAGALGGARRAGDRVAELLEMVGLAGYGERRVTTLSGGEAQRVALARALAPNPRLLLLDEPLAALDTSLRATLLADLARVLESTRTTALFVTHDQDEAAAIADRIALMRRGRIVQIGTPDAVRSHPVDEEAAAFLGRDRARRHRFDSVGAGYDASRPDSGPPANADPHADRVGIAAGAWDTPPVQIVVAGAVVAAGTVLIARRAAPPSLAGKWELPGGKVEPRESEESALAREFAEELGLEILVGPRIGAPIQLGDTPDGRDAEMHLFRAEPATGETSYVVDLAVHTEVRWVSADDLDTVDWVPADRRLVEAIRPLLTRAAEGAGDGRRLSETGGRRSALRTGDLDKP